MPFLEEFAIELKPVSNNDETGSEVVIPQNILSHKESNSCRDCKLKYNLGEEWKKMDDADKNSDK